MTVEKHTQKMYDEFGAEYQKTRDNERPERAYNEHMELPAMLKALGNIKGKRILDIGCGAGVHAKKYMAKGAIVEGIDISKTMIELAKKRCPKAKFKVGTFKKIPYKNSSFNIVTGSLCIDYLNSKEMSATFKEVSRVLKKRGLFFFSNESPVNAARDKYEDKNIRIKATGTVLFKKTGKKLSLGSAFKDWIVEWEMVPGMLMKTYKHTFRTQLLALRKAGFELIDFIDCKPTLGFKKVNPDDYKIFSKFPIFSIFVAKKK
ncbi:MAG: methyltransferase domain-containing protein [Nanoarchaeota archaeon]|nr:methyltransferase domain-containing protein [Nanoarchaeota archaeon]MBU1321997.1 methyltransferase domain-containing protein [Nanoarchaeota archaeon]MBU1597971.1 methyltransferase domain-containing protein [Nanoarchaeota archaeon]MBU2442337.1 methyltransferase domain-containing protein [Nanoarchaeota archaeon]